MIKFIGFPAFLLAVIFLGGCSYYSSNDTPAPFKSQPVSEQKSETTNNASAVNIQGFAFSPGTLTVKKGATVTWTNNDSAPHQIKSAKFNSNQLGKGQSFSFTFNEAGTFDYICSIHPSMTGKIVVE